MVKSKKSKTGCHFCDYKQFKKRVIDEDKDWHAFIPKDPEIYGHCIVTTKKHYEDILSSDGKEALDIMSEGLKIVADKIKKIDEKRIHKVYFAMVGETKKTHMHYHLFPRYRFEHDSEIYEWAEEHKFDKGSYGWQKFYEVPTLGFKSFTGFQYLGEIEKSYDETKRRIGKKPSSDLVKVMVKKIRDL